MSSGSFVPPVSPPRFDATPHSIERDTNQLITERASFVDRVVKFKDDPLNAFEKGILPWIEYENTYIRRRRLLGYFSNESPDVDVREASREASKKFNQADVELYARQDFYELVKSARSKTIDLDPEYVHYLKLKEESFETNGLTLTDPIKLKEYKELKNKINNLQTDLVKRINDDANAGSWFRRDDLEGLPDSYLDSHKKFRDDGGDPNADIWISSKESDTTIFFQHVINSEVRKAHFIVSQNRGVANSSMYRELFMLKDQAAKILGYSSHAAFRTNYQTMKTPENVLGFLKDLAVRLKPKAKQHASDLLKLKAEHLKESGQQTDNSGILFQWDQAFYTRLLKEEVCDFDSSFISEYFSLQHSIKILLGFYEHLFGVFIKEYSPKDHEVIAKDVYVYTIWDADNHNAFIGYFYFDPFPRPGKYSHFGHFGLQPGNALDPNNIAYPVSVISANFPPPTADTPSLLTHGLLRRLFHEIGHAMHGTLSMTKCAAVQGTGSLGRDYAEAVAIMFEAFLWQPRHMRECSLHYSYQSPAYEAAWRKANPGKERPPRTLDEGVIERLVLSRTVGLAEDRMRQIMMSLYDFKVHGPGDEIDLATINLAELYNKMFFDMIGAHGLEVETGKWDQLHRYTSLRHLVAGYDSYIYAYVFSRMWADDLFHTGFAKDTMSIEAGRRYRRIVLQPGGSKDSADILREFLGREPNDEAFLRALGVTNDDDGKL
jgi:metallopeptidase MepB